VDRLAEIPLDEEKVRDNQIITEWILHYHERKRKYNQRREEILESSRGSQISEVPGRTKYKTSDTTGNKGQKLADLSKTERWLAFIEELERRLPWKMQIIMRLRQESRYSRTWGGYWIIYVQRRYAEELAALFRKRVQDVWVSEESIRAYWRMILEYAGRLAAKKGLL